MPAERVKDVRHGSSVRDGFYRQLIGVDTRTGPDLHLGTCSRLGFGGRSILSETGSVTVSGTAGWQTWQSAWLRDIDLPAGERVLKVTVRSGGFNLNTMRITEADPTSAEEEPETSVSLLGIFPNPAEGRTTVRFRTSEPAHVSLAAFDMLGRRVRMVPERPFAIGEHGIDVDLPPGSGVYVVRVLLRGASDAFSYEEVITVVL